MGKTTRRLLLSRAVYGAAATALSGCSGYPVRYGDDSYVRAEAQRQDKPKISHDVMVRIEFLYSYLMSKTEAVQPNNGSNGISSKYDIEAVPNMAVMGGSRDYEVYASQPGILGLFIVVHGRNGARSFSVHDSNLDGIVDAACILRDAGQGRAEPLTVQSPEQFNNNYHQAVGDIIKLMNARR